MTRRFPRWPVAIALLVATAPDTALAQAPATPPPPPPPQAAPPVLNFPPPPVKGGPAGVAIVVNGQPITRTQVVQTALSLAGQQAMQQIIADTLIEQEAKKQGVTATPTEINARMAQVRQQLQSYPGGLDAYLKSKNTTMADLRNNMRVRIEVQKLAQRGQKPVHRVHIHYIVVLTTNPNNDPNAKPHTDTEAKAIIAKAQADLASGQKFEDVVAKYSEDPGKNNGGDIGIIGPESTGRLDANFIKAALALKPGEVTQTPVFSSQFGYFLLKAVSTSEAPGTDQALYDQAEQQTAGQQANTYFQKLLSSAKITNYMTQ